MRAPDRVSTPPDTNGDSRTLADPERALALLYATAAVRPALSALWRLDERFGAVVAGTSEAMIGRIRLAWWREALERLDSAPPPAEPLLAEIAATLLPLGITGTELAEMEPGWAALVDSPPDIATHARERGGRLFALAAEILLSSSLPRRREPRSAIKGGIGSAGTGPPPLRWRRAVEDAGERWALADLAHRLSDPARRTAARGAGQAIPAPRHWPHALRPLGALSVLATRDLAAEARVQGTPGRAARMLWHRLTGR